MTDDGRPKTDTNFGHPSSVFGQEYYGLLGLVSKIETAPTGEWHQGAERQTIWQNVVGKPVA